MKNQLKRYDATLSPTSSFSLNSLLLGGEAGRKREEKLKIELFELLIKTDPEKAIQTVMGREKLVDILAYFNSHNQKEKSQSYRKQKVASATFYSKTASALKPEFKLRQYPNDNIIRVYSLGSYAGYIAPQTLWELPQYFPNKCEKILRPIICKKLLTQNV